MTKKEHESEGLFNYICPPFGMTEDFWEQLTKQANKAYAPIFYEYHKGKK